MNPLSILRITRRVPRFIRAYSSKEESPWFIDNKPGPYPKTEEEMCAAAKKYNLLREEYEPYPDDGNGYGDYPKIEAVNVENKNIYYPWSDSLHRRDYLDPIPVDFIYYTTGRIDESRSRYSALFMTICFSLAMGVVALVVLLPQCREFKYHHPIMAKQYPKSGEKHYTFEFVDEASASKH